MRLGSRVFAPALAVIFSAGLLFFPSTAKAIGGGAPFQITCPSGSVMSGIEGRTGAWVDEFQVLCNNMGNVEKKAVPTVGYSPGGSFTRAVCPAFSGVSTIEFDYVDSGGGVLVVNKIKLTCRAYSAWMDSVRYAPVFGQNDAGSSDDYSIECSRGSFIYELRVHAWNYIDSIDGTGCRQRVSDN